MKPEIVEKSLDFCISGEVSRADSVYTVISAAQNPNARAATWSWIVKNLETLRSLFSGTPTVSSLLQEVISHAGIGRESQIKEYFSKTKITEADKGISKGIQLLGAYSDLAERLKR